MKAWVVTGTGEPKDVLKLQDVEQPILDADTVGIEPRAVGLNFLDAMACRGTYPWNPEPPYIPCAELVGQIHDPNGVPGFSVGQRVIAMIPTACGALAERCVLPSRYVFPVDPKIPDETAAALLVTYQTAGFAMERANLQAGDTVLVHGGAGGVGTAAIQLCKLHRVRVIATAGSDYKLENCRELGADLTINYRTQDFAREVMDFTDGHGADVVLDPVGGPAFENSLDCLALDGRIVLIGWASGQIPRIDAQLLVMHNHTVIGLSWGSTYPIKQPDRVLRMNALIQEHVVKGRLTPMVARTAPFDQAPQLMQALATGSTVGKAVVFV